MSGIVLIYLILGGICVGMLLSSRRYRYEIQVGLAITALLCFLGAVARA